MSLQHTITTSDTIHSIALRYYGDATAWPTLVAQNMLRPPYLGATIRDTFGPARGVATLATLATAGDVTIRLSNIPDSLTLGDTLFYERTTATGTTRYTSRIVARDAGLIEVADPLPASIPINQPILLFAPAPVGRVALPGETLIIDQTTDVVTIDPVATYGADLAADTHGNLLLTAQGDVQIVAGLDNIAMQIAHRLRVATQSLPLHPSYGNDALTVIGTAPSDYHAAIVQAYTALALANETRITSVESITVTRTGSSLSIAVAASATDGSPVALSVIV